MRTIKIWSVIVLAMFPFIVHAQDVIVKNDGSTISSKVTEITSTEIKYKKFSNLNGPTYTIGKSEVNYINYENGEKETFTSISLTDLDATPKSTFATPQNNLQTTDSKLLESYYRPSAALKKAKRLRNTGLIGGGIFLAASISCFAFNEYEYKETYICGGVAAGACVLWTTSFLYAAKAQRNKASLFAHTTIPIMQFEIADSKHSKLYANINILDEGIKHNKSLGIGLHLIF